MQFDLSDWEKRKAALLPLLQDATSRGLLASEQAVKLTDYLVSRGLDARRLAAASSVEGEGLSAPRDDSAGPSEVAEAPRFIRGFHDILITIGILVLIAGLGGLTRVYVIPVVAIVLAEILVKRQRLALPAVVLTLAFGGSVGFAAGTFINAGWPGMMEDLLLTLSALCAAVCLALFYWRYQVPLALSAVIALAFAVVVEGGSLLIWSASADPLFYSKRPWLVAFYIGVFAVLTFGMALRFDLADRMRVTRRSDVAFWLHLVAAPALLYTLIAVIYLSRGNQIFGTEPSLWQAVAIVFSVAALMLTGIVLDRRAFVTSGLVSLGYAINILLSKGSLEGLLKSADSLFFIILIAIGVVVLSLGIGWQPLRRIVVGALPENLSGRLPPVAA
ncbi:hypothetical protein [Rhizobium alvei]|uniref:DUF2157 domain-containing protein n=1 Tax=Rhizobium alvei TaxID=1132659 RepID=A0ABT8YKM3_9HYPH|nr:hypothetical protein [Rhizobium alvei]MDO6964230.1 hypothetical protein [Rhizobium alvei]